MIIWIIWFFLWLTAAFSIYLLLFLVYMEKKLSSQSESSLKDGWLKNIYMRYLDTCKDKGNQTIVYAEELFTIEAIMEEASEKHPHLVKFLPKLIPGFSVGLGLLGTFVGFTEGISAFNTNSAESIMKSIDQLLSGIKSAFNTSIVGLSISLVFSFGYNWRLTRIQRKVSQLTYDLNNKHHIEESDYIVSEFSTRYNENFLKPGEILNNLLEKVDSQAQAIQAFSTDLATQLTNFTDSFTTRLSDEMVEKFNNEMYQLYQTLFEPTLVEIKQITDALRKEKGESAAAVIEKITTDLKETLNKMVADFQKTVSNDTKTELEQLSKLIQNAGSSFQQLPIVVTNSIKELNFFQNEVLKQMKEQADKLHETVNTIDSLFEKEKAIRSLSEQLFKSSQQIESFILPMKESIQQLTVIVGENNDRNKIVLDIVKEQINQIRYLAESLEKIDSELASVFDKLIEKTQQYQQVMNESFTSNLKEYTDSIESFSKRLANAAEALRDTIEDLKDSLPTNSNEVA